MKYPGIITVHWTSTAGASQQYANIECEAAKEPNLSDEKAKRKEVREEGNILQERIEEAKKLFNEMCAAEILAWEEIDATLHW